MLLDLGLKERILKPKISFMTPLSIDTLFVFSSKMNILVALWISLLGFGLDRFLME